MTIVALGKGSLGSNKSGPIGENIDQSDESWDPEYCVSYVVKYKGMQASEATWEYLKDTNQDYLDAAEDSW